MKIVKTRDKKLKRQAIFKDIDFRAIQENGVKKVRGYPILFNTETVIFEDWKETISPKALDGVNLSELRLLVGHNSDKLLGRAGINLRVEVDEIGLFIEAELPDTQLANDTYTLVNMGILDGMSFAFYVEEITTNWEKKIDTILKFKEVPEVSIVTFPAYPQTVVIATTQEVDYTEEQEEPKDSKKEALKKLIEIL